MSKLTGMTATTSERLYAASFHNVGNISLSVTNFNLWGEGNQYFPDHFTGELYWFGSEYPIGSEIPNLRYGTFWIGGVIGNDTLVSSGAHYLWIPAYEYHPDPLPGFGLETRSVLDDDPSDDSLAVSEQDFICVYTDTMTDIPYYERDFLRGGGHQPLNVKVTQKSYAWSNDAFQDFILFEVIVENIGQKTISDAYFGIMYRPAIGFAFTFG
ncbi:MAG: hypothetical protein JSU74_04060 [Candidatus Zixiibacteriota bacterium]|nr:MAG: hypothetical protein JSU74_04060 [candidate division Zixibacteria bacterium]